MTTQELIRILKRFPKTATVCINTTEAAKSSQNISIQAQCNQDAEWSIILSVDKNIIEKDEKTSC